MIAADSIIMTGMDPLSIFLVRYQPQTEEVVIWDQLRLRVITYLCDELPPSEKITSVRALVCNGEQVLVVRDPESIHILPGGRCEPGETLEQTLHREVLEETGWQIDRLHLLGLKHFHHLTPKPNNYLYPYPDFVQIIYCALPIRYLANARQIDGYELEATLTPLAELDSQHLSANERMFLSAALSR